MDKNQILSESTKIELHSDEVQEIMGAVPHWTVRSGITIILLIVILLVGGSLVFKYPDVITSTVVIISENPSASIVARTNGKIDNLFIQNEKIVKHGELLAILENPANYLHVLALKYKLNEFSLFFKDPLNATKLEFPKDYSLGQVQSSFSGFQRQYEEYLSFLKVDMIQKKIVAIKNQHKDYSSFIDRLKNQALNQEKTLELNQKQFLRDSMLFRNGVIAAADYEKSEQNLLQVKSSYQSLLASLANNDMQINQLIYQIIDLESQQMDQIHTKINGLKESLDNLRAVIADWEKAYVLTSPIEGKITFTKFWSQNQYVLPGDKVFTIVPIKPQNLVGRVKLPISGSGKVKAGQLVYIKLENYPFMEFGLLEGRIKSISLVPEKIDNGNFYTAEIILPHGLITNYHKKLPFSQELQGSAEIITNNMTLFDRLINPLKTVVEKSLTSN